MLLLPSAFLLGYTLNPQTGFRSLKLALYPLTHTQLHSNILEYKVRVSSHVRHRPVHSS